MANLVVHFEIHASQPQALIDFYGELFGWTFSRFGDVPYWVIDTGEGAIGIDTPGGGINGGLTQRDGPSPEPGAPISGCNIVVGVESGVDEVFVRALALGASEASPLEDMEGVGRGGYLFDPDGNLFGIMSPTLSDGTIAMGG
jgi:predicted enzyme related to lactoylglutathione lyase